MSKEFTNKDFINGNFIKEIEPIVYKGKTRNYTHRQGLFKCLCCGKEFKAGLHNAFRTQQQCCSVKCATIMKKDMDGFHEGHPLYSRWLSMKQRCFNSKNCNAKNYHDRGITIEPYLLDFKNYVEYVSSLPNYVENPSRFYQLDRIDNNKGYQRGNLRWVHMDVQSSNKRGYPTLRKYSKHVGISFNKRTKKWIARVTFQKKTLFQKCDFLTEQEAYMARKEFILKNGLPNCYE